MINLVSMRKRITSIINWLKLNVDVFLLSLVGGFLRFRVILRDDLWYDEAFTGVLMRVGREEFWNVISKDPHPPLYYLLLKGWTYIFGVNDFSLRSLSAIFGVLLIIAVYYLVKKLFSRETAEIAAFLTAVNPFLISYSVEARSYMMFGFLMALAVYFLVLRKMNLFVLTLIVLMFVHYMFAAFVPVMLLYYFYLVWREKRGLLRGLVRIVPFILVALYLYLPVLNNSVYNSLNIDWVDKPSLANIPRSITAYSYGVKSRLSGVDELADVNFLFDEYILGYGVFIIFVLGTVAVLIKERKNADNLVKFLFTQLMIYIPMLTLIGYSLYKEKSVYIERYLLPASIFFIISLSYILTSLLTWELLGLVVFFYVFTITRAATPGYYKGMKDLTRNFNNYEGEVVFTSPIDYVVGKYYFDNERVKLYIPKDPNFAYNWPFMSNARPQDIDTAIFVSPDEQRMTDEYTKPLQNLSFGNYVIYIREGQKQPAI